MRKTFILLFILVGLTNFCAGQERLEFTKVVQTDSIDRESIFVSIKAWLSMEFKKGNNAIELEDKEAGLIIANASSDYTSTKRGLSYVWADGSIDHKINIQIRDNRFKVTITNFLLKCPNSAGVKMGVLTTAEESNYTAWGKKQYNEVWIDLKVKAKKISDDWFQKFESIKFKDFKSDTGEDW